MEPFDARVLSPHLADPTGAFMGKAGDHEDAECALICIAGKWTWLAVAGGGGPFTQEMTAQLEQFTTHFDNLRENTN